MDDPFPFMEIEQAKEIINKGIERLEIVFDANGGRGVDVAECLDRLRAAFDVLNGERADTPSEKYIGITAKCHDDDYAFEVEFDATRYFAKMDDDTLFVTVSDLRHCDYCADYAADNVALAAKEWDSRVRAFFELKKPGVGFEVGVDGDELTAWMEKNRPSVMSRIKEEKHG